MQTPNNNNEEDYLDRKPAAKVIPKEHTAVNSTHVPSTEPNFSDDTEFPVTMDSATLVPLSNIRDERKIENDSCNDQRNTIRFDPIVETNLHKTSTNLLGTLLTERPANKDPRVENEVNLNGLTQDILDECTSVLSSKLLDEIPDEAKNQHLLKLLLFFSNDTYDKNRLDDLARKCGFSKMFLEKRIDLLNSNAVDESHSAGSIFESDASLPFSLATLAEIVRYQDCAKRKLPVVSGEHNDEVKPSSCIALQLYDLELSTRQWYFNTIAIGHTANPHKGHKSTAPRAVTRSARFFSLKYNEGSLSTISRWSCRNGPHETKVIRSPGNSVLSGTQSPEGTDTSRTGLLPLSPEGGKAKEKPTKIDFIRPLKHPTVDKRFRKCTVCNFWGHYEIECEKLPPTDLMRFARELNAHKHSLKSSITTNSSLCIDGSTSEDIALASNDRLDSTRSGQQKHDIMKDSIKNLNDTNDVSVGVEIFQGFLVEQRKEPEAPNASSFHEDNEIHSIPVYDDSFLVDGFAIKAATSLKELENGEAFSLSSGNRTKTRNFVRRNTPKRLLDSFVEGDIVAWFAEPRDKDNVYTGIVVKAPTTVSNVRDTSSSNLICVEFLTSIPPSPDSESGGFKVLKTTDNLNDPLLSATKLDTIDDTSSSYGPAKCSQLGCGSITWIHENDLFLVHERWNITHPEELRGKKRKYNSRKKIESMQHDVTKTNLATTVAATGSKGHSRIKPMLKNTKASKSRSMSYRERFKESGRVQPKDMSLAPRKPARKLADGTYSMPQGRRPVGLDWDHIRGVWSLPKKETKSKQRR